MIRASIAALLAGLSITAHAQTWKYNYADQQYGRHKFTFEARAGAPDEIASGSGRYLSRQLGGSKTLLEYLPYALAGGEPPASWPAPSGYPTYATPYIEWKYAIKVGGWESVTVPAGTFRALRIDVEGNRGKDPDPFWWPKQAARFQHTIWYAPEAKRYVKARHQAWSMTASLFADDLVELLEIRPN